MPGALIIRHAGISNYVDTLAAMQAFTARRSATTPDEIWLLQHEPVFTLGLNSKPEHLLAPGEIPVVQVDRGGQVTYHGPGQLLVYLLLDLKRARLGVKNMVRAMEQAITATLASYGIEANCQTGAPGVYVAGAKVASIGLRIKRGCSYHGLALNVCPDLAPFERINPCGYPGLAVCSLSQLGGPANINTVAADLYPKIIDYLSLQAEVREEALILDAFA